MQRAKKAEEDCNMLADIAEGLCAVSLSGRSCALTAARPCWACDLGACLKYAPVASLTGRGFNSERAASFYHCAQR